MIANLSAPSGLASQKDDEDEDGEDVAADEVEATEEA